MKAIAKTLLSATLATTFFAFSVSHKAVADSPSSYEMEKGNAVILCERTEPVPDADFEAVFGHWQNYIMEQYNDNAVYLSQFTQAMNKGLVIVVNKHDSAAKNVNHAETMLGEMNKIAENNGVKRDKTSCNIMAMGPIWLAPKN